MCTCNRPHLFTFFIALEAVGTEKPAYLCEVTENGIEFVTFVAPSRFELFFMLRNIAKGIRDEFAALEDFLPPLFTVKTAIPDLEESFNSKMAEKNGHLQ